ncbi:cytochrome P450 monooxygenase [Aspergillus bombycis]|uniref:Cytochrome P450 monooxygenase n=1 Tax=Aspergillus bombycis TaxID=109264 RepID=A0A1F7ZT81_9EURO|nr:cytochrome P450 monooxygenase [Aspergillus bombycis]OGM42661.1 cytochrome P450 monooxygenase [Aspergillus bombycis]
MDYMHSILSGPALGIICGVILIFLGIVIHDVHLWKCLPPGPVPTPLIGNKLQIPSKHPWIKLQEWSRIYGPIYTIWLGRRPTVVISDPSIASELLEKRSKKYSTRPRFVTMGEIYWDMASILVQPYGKEWLIRRRLLHSALTPRALDNYKLLQQAESSRLCYQLLESAHEWESLFDRLASSIVFAVSYGHRVDSAESPVVRQRLEFMQYASSLNVPGAYLVESFPILKYLPDWIVPWKAEIKRRGRLEADANMTLVHVVRQDIESAKQSPGAEPLFNSLTKQLLEARDSDPTAFPLTERDFSYIPASLFGAGSDTTSSTLCSAMLAIVTNQVVLEIAQAELDSVVGPGRLPTFEDIPKLPYLRALCKEVLRWRPVAILGGTPHACSEDDYYRGYYIPQGTVMLGNSWAINMNPTYYPSPDQFNPFRFLDIDPHRLPYLPKEYIPSVKQDKGSAHPSKLGHSSFGWGRRICPGADLATNTLLITLCRLLWCFHIRPIPGHVYDTLDYTNGFNVRPRNLQLGLQVRSDQHRHVLEREYEDAIAFLQTLSPFDENMLQSTGRQV